MDEYDPFAPQIPDESSDLLALARALQLAKGFTLLFVTCNRADDRERLMNELQTRVPKLRIQRIPVRKETRNLLHDLHDILDKPTPDAVFIYGMEAWIPADVEPNRIPFILNLNAARNYFYKEVPCAFVIWAPQYLVNLIRRDAPDFFSVRSGLFTFAPSPDSLKHFTQSLTSLGNIALEGLPYDEKQERVETLTKMLYEYEVLPESLRDPLAEARIREILASLYYNMGNFIAAEPLLVQALEINEKVLGTEHPDTMTSLNNLAVLYKTQHRYEKAEPLYIRTLEIRERALGVEHPNTALSLNNLAVLYDDQGLHEKAEPLLIRALEINEKVLGQEHPNTASTLNNLAQLYFDQGQYEKAEPLYVRTLEIREKVLGSEHPGIAESLNNLAGLYFVQGKYADAEPLIGRVVGIYEKVFGKAHPNTAAGYRNYAFVLAALGRAEEAEAMARRAIEIEDSYRRLNAPVVPLVPHS